VIIQITWNEGRTVEQKKQLYKATADGLAQSPGIRTENVFILSRSKKRSGLSARERRSMLTNGHPMCTSAPFFMLELDAVSRFSLPRIARALDASFAGIEWVVTAYTSF